MNTEFLSFEFPKYEDIVKANKPFLKVKSYRGYEITVPVAENLYLNIECQNESVINKKNDDVLRFAWTNNAGFAIAQTRYANNEAGYLVGCAYLVQSAAEICEAFKQFVGKHCKNIKDAIQEYDAAHPEDGE